MLVVSNFFIYVGDQVINISEYCQTQNNSKRESYKNDKTYKQEVVEKYGEENFFNSLKNWRLNLWKTWIEK